MSKQATERPELLNCPFCNAAPSIEQGYSSGRKPLRTWAVCRTPGCAINDLEILVEKWSARSRATEAAPADVEAALVELQEMFPVGNHGIRWAIFHNNSRVCWVSVQDRSGQMNEFPGYKLAEAMAAVRAWKEQQQ